jgi:uncharacterized membrane protein YebE (DUF533 family)
MQVQQNTGGLGDVVGRTFEQAKAGVQEGAGRLNEATGASQRIDDMIRQITGAQSSPEVIAKIKELIAQNQLGAGAAATGLGALVLGTKTGRSLALEAAKLGGLVLIGGLAYKAYQNVSQGKSALGDQNALPTAAPPGSGFEPAAQTPEHALLCVRAMIAAAAADGQITETERQRIIGGLKQVGMQEPAAEFLRQEFAKPATPAELAAGSDSPQMDLQVYTAARLAIEPNSKEERAFLAALQTALGIGADLVANIDARAIALKS